MNSELANQDFTINIRALIVAVIAQAVKEACGSKVNCWWSRGYQQKALKNPNTKRTFAHFQQRTENSKRFARNWIALWSWDDIEEPFTFAWCCEQLGLSPCTTSKRLLKLIETPMNKATKAGYSETIASRGQSSLPRSLLKLLDDDSISSQHFRVVDWRKRA